MTYKLPSPHGSWWTAVHDRPGRGVHAKPAQKTIIVLQPRREHAFERVHSVSVGVVVALVDAISALLGAARIINGYSVAAYRYRSPHVDFVLPAVSNDAAYVNTGWDPADALQCHPLRNGEYLGCNFTEVGQSIFREKLPEPLLGD